MYILFNSGFTIPNAEYAAPNAKNRWSICQLEMVDNTKLYSQYYSHIPVYVAALILVLFRFLILISISRVCVPQLEMVDKKSLVYLSIGNGR